MFISKKELERLREAIVDNRNFTERVNDKINALASRFGLNINYKYSHYAVTKNPKGGKLWK